MVITLPYSPFKEPLDWAKENCLSYVTNDLHQDGYYTYDRTKIDYFFGDEKDVVMFALRWGA